MAGLFQALAQAEATYGQTLTKLATEANQVIAKTQDPKHASKQLDGR
jgi:hypothetical protein